MKVFLDTFDLINLLEKEEPGAVEEFNEVLQLLKATLVVCPRHLEELAAPLTAGDGRSSTMATLNKLECLPLMFANEVKIPILELAEAIRAFGDGREVEPVDPFVARLDAAVPLVGRSPTERFLNYPLAEIAFDLWQNSPDVLRRHPEHAAKLRGAVQHWRTTTKAGGNRSDFVATVSELAMRNAQFGLRLEGVDVKGLGRWLWDSPRRSPGISLWYRARNHVVRNRNYQIRDSDVADLSWMWLLPYVDVATLDRRMKDYLRRVLSEEDEVLCAEVHGSLHDVLESLKTEGGLNRSPNNSLEQAAKTPPLSS